MVDSMVRADELLSMTVAQVNIPAGAATVSRGKGGRGRVVPFGPATARALDRYKRARSRHPLASRPDFWLGSRGRGLSYDGLYATLRRRSARAGFTLHPHQLRATGAIRWRAAGGSVPGLLTVAGVVAGHGGALRAGRGEPARGRGSAAAARERPVRRPLNHYQMECCVVRQVKCSRILTDIHGRSRGGHYRALPGSMARLTPFRRCPKVAPDYQRITLVKVTQNAAAWPVS